MLKMFMPRMVAETIHEIDIDELLKNGIKGIILDIDNTLESHRVPKPSEKTLEFLKKLKDSGIKICLISNGAKERVALFNENLGYFALGKAGKPLKKGYMRAAKEMELSPKDIAMVGDQIFTDVLGANMCGMYSVLVTPIESIENGFFYIKRYFEKYIRQKIEK